MKLLNNNTFCIDKPQERIFRRNTFPYSEKEKGNVELMLLINKFFSNIGKKFIIPNEKTKNLCDLIKNKYLLLKIYFYTEQYANKYCEYKNYKLLDKKFPKNLYVRIN